ncbi:hypothetical protein G6F45_013797 [Rhizopus arrhizus]|nr:hypothetical protein G6F45_013797 [Rhizopus arrhizus]
MDNNINQELNNTLAGLCNMVKALSDQVQHLVTKFDTLEVANNQLKAELDNMRAVVKQLTSLNARPLSQPAKPFKATAKQPVIDILALNAPGTEASKHATAKPATVESYTTVDSSTTSTSSNPAAWITNVSVRLLLVLLTRPHPFPHLAMTMSMFTALDD